MPVLSPPLVQMPFKWLTGGIFEPPMRLKNLSEAVERFLDTQRPAIQEASLASTQPTDNQEVTTVATLTETDLPQSTTEQTVFSQPQDKPIPTEKRNAVYQRTKELQREGHGIRAVARHLGAARNTIKQYFRQDQFVPRPRPKRSNLLNYETYGTGHPAAKTLDRRRNQCQGTPGGD